MVSMFGDKMWENVIIAVSFWYHDVNSRRLRLWPKPGTNITHDEEWFKKTWGDSLRDKFEIPEHVALDFVFIDSQSQLPYNVDDDVQQEIFKNETKKFWELQSQKSTFKFRTIDDVLTENILLKEERRALENIVYKHMGSLAEDDKKSIVEKLE